MIPFLRIYDLSITNYLKYEVLPLHFVEAVLGDTFTFDAPSNSYIVDNIQEIDPRPVSLGRGWSVFDENIVGGNAVVDTASEQTTQVTVYGPSTFTIDYPNGRIIAPNVPPTSVDYNWYYVSVIQGWPGVDPPPLPIVATDISRTEKAGFQLGGGTKDSISGSVYIFARDEAEKKDITDVVYQAFYNRTIPINNWHEGGYLDFNGTFAGFSPAPVSGLSSGFFKDVEARLDGARLDWSEVNRHRSRVDFVFEVFKDD